MDLTQFDGHTQGPWAKSDRMAGPWWGISSQYSVDGRPCESGRQSVANVHGAHRGSGYAAMFEANARLIAAAPDLLAEVRRLTAEADAMRRERDELAARLAEIEQAEPARQELTALERDLLEALQGAYSLAIGHAATYQHQHQLAAPHPTHAEILSQSRAAIAKASAPTADVPARADSQPRPTCSSSGLLGATSGVGRECGMWIEGVCTSPDSCQHQQPVKPCRTCGPDGCPDRVSCPRGER